ncbi:hypothetical protein L1987_08721 [Smallanthus sonchifolius]|uniref:Uncharacterized protein n=1 Tax=Smallanthus sonchifolius TaxID=185202 RepID=A0ACB9JLY9_9ASTR|nr:hypothetical protein L1987_08721 [Smallanthus sonchifolius]
MLVLALRFCFKFGNQVLLQFGIKVHNLEIKLRSSREGRRKVSDKQEEKRKNKRIKLGIRSKGELKGGSSYSRF